MQAYNHKALINLIRSKLGNDVIQRSIDIEDKNHYTGIYKTRLLDSFTDNAIHSHAKKYWDKSYVKVDDFIDYITNFANTKNTKGKYHEYMDYVHAYYDICTRNDIPEYNTIRDKKLKEKIEPKRIEFFIAWWICNMTKKDPFLGKYSQSNPVFQHEIGSNDDRFYDIVFEDLDIIIEVQEDSSNHHNNTNDILKNALAKVRNKRIIYFKLTEYKTYNYQYLDRFWSDLQDMLYQGILSISEEIRKDYVFYAFKQNCKNELTMIKKELRNETLHNYEIEGRTFRKRVLTSIIGKSDDKEIIDELFDLKANMKTCSDHVITVDNIAKIFRAVDKKNISKITKEIYQSGQYQVINQELRINWNALIKFIQRTDICDTLIKDIMLDYCTSVEDIYESITQKILTHYRAKVQFSFEHQKLVEEHIEAKIKAHYEPQIQSLKQDIEILETCEMVNIRKLRDFNKFCNKTYDIMKDKATNKKEKGLLEKMSTLLEQQNILYQNTKYIPVTFKRDHNKSIFEELPDFPIVYSGHKLSTIDRGLFETICKEYDVPKAVIRNVSIDLCYPNYYTYCQVIPLVTIKKEYTKYYKITNDESSDEGSDGESDEGSDGELDESDGKSDDVNSEVEEDDF